MSRESIEKEKAKHNYNKPDDKTKELDEFVNIVSGNFHQGK